MFLLTDRFEDSFEYGGNVLNIDMSYDNILRMFEMFEDDIFRVYEKIEIALQMLVMEYELIEGIDFTEKYDLYSYVMKEFLGIDSDKKEQEKKIMDFQKDAGLIYASFLSEYNIDLFKVQGELHWKKFSELLSNLGDETVFKQVVGYRVMKVPSTKDASEEHRKHIQKMKRIYSLDDAKDVQGSMEDKLDSIASTFGVGKSEGNKM